MAMKMMMMQLMKQAASFRMTANSYEKKSKSIKLNAQKYGKMSKLYYMASLKFMRKSGFLYKNGMQYMNIYKTYLIKEKNCKNNITAFKLNMSALKKQANQLLKTIQATQMKKETLWVNNNYNSMIKSRNSKNVKYTNKISYTVSPVKIEVARKKVVVVDYSAQWKAFQTRLLEKKYAFRAAAKIRARAATRARAAARAAFRARAIARAAFRARATARASARARATA